MRLNQKKRKQKKLGPLNNYSSAIDLLRHRNDMSDKREYCIYSWDHWYFRFQETIDNIRRDKSYNSLLFTVFFSVFLTCVVVSVDFLEGEVFILEGSNLLVLNRKEKTVSEIRIFQVFHDRASKRSRSLSDTLRSSQNISVSVCVLCFSS